MVILRLVLIAFNVAVVTYLVYRMLQVIQYPIERSKKVIIVVAGLILLVTPFSMFFGIIRPSVLYFLIYPVAVSLFLYLIWEIR